MAIVALPKTLVVEFVFGDDGWTWRCPLCDETETWPTMFGAGDTLGQHIDDRHWDDEAPLP